MAGPLPSPKISPTSWLDDILWMDGYRVWMSTATAVGAELGAWYGMSLSLSSSSSCPQIRWRRPSHAMALPRVLELPLVFEISTT